MLHSPVRADVMTIPVDMPSVIDLIRQHLPAIRETARVSGSRKMRKMIRDFEAVVQANAATVLPLAAADMTVEPDHLGR